MNGVDKMKRYQDAGFTDEELGTWAVNKRKELSDAGFGQGEIDTYFGHPPFDPEPIKALVTENHKQYTQPTAEGGELKEVKDFSEAFLAGLGMSSTGLLIKKPTSVVAEDAPRSSQIASMVGTLAGDIPAMVGGFAAGGVNPVTGMAGAFALPAGIRKIMMDKYEKGEVEGFGDFWNRLSGAFIDTAKGWITGAATGVVGKAIQAAPIVSPTAKTAATLTGEVATMVSVGSALEGQVPEPDDFINAALALGFVKGSAKMAGKLRKIYAETGVKPDEVAVDILKDPTILQDLASDKIIPDRYADEMAKARRPEPKPTGPQPTGEVAVVTPPKRITDLAKGTQARVETGSETGAFFDQPREYMATGTDGEPVKPFEKPRFLRSAEEILQEKNALPVRPAEDLIDPNKPRVREKRYFPPEPRGEDTESTIGADLARALSEEGIPFGKFKKIKIDMGEDAPARWETDLAKQDPEGQVAAKLSVGQQPKERMTWNRLYTLAIDELNPIREAVKESKQDLITADDPYYLARLSRGTFGKADHFLEQATFDFKTYENTGKSLKQILDPVKGDLDQFRVYTAAKRTVELADRGVESGINPLAAKEVIKGKEAKFGPVFKELVQYQNEVTRYLRDAGVVSPKVYEQMTEANRHYVPFYRVLEQGLSGGAGSGRGLTTKNPLKKIVGSERDIVDPLESVIKNTYTYLALAERNAVGVKFIEMAKATGHPEDFAKRVTPVEKSPLTDEQIKQFLAESGSKADVAVQKTLAEASSPLADNHIAVFEEGKRVVYEVQPEVAAAFKASDAETANLLLKILSVPAKTLRAGSILSPDFIARNSIRDQLSAFILTRGGYLPIFDFVRGAISLKTQDDAFGNWLKGGGANAAMVSVDRLYLQENIFKLSKETGLMEKAWNVAKSPLEMLRIASELTENATRLGEFKRVTAGKTGKAAIQEGAMASREVTLDFARIGAKMRAVNMIAAFSNAQIQGVDRIVRAFGENPLGTTAKIGAAVTLPSILLWYANHDDPRYKEIPTWQKDLFWIVMTEDHIFRIPKPFEIGLVFGTLPERALDAYFTDNPHAFKDFEKSVMDAFLPNLTPNVAQPIIEQFSNRSLFTGNPIVPSNVEKMLPEYQYAAYTTEAAKALGSMFSAFPGMERRAVADESMIGGTARALTTPVLIENYIRAWSGGMGMYALQLADKALREAGALPDPVLPAATLADLPIIKAFTVRYPAASAQSVQEFYDDYYVSKRYFDTVMGLAQQGDPRAEQVLNAHQADMAQLSDLREALTEHSQMIRLIHKNPDMTPTDKRQLIDTLYFRMIDLARAGNESLRELSQAFSPKETTR